MNSKKSLMALVLLVTIINVSVVFGANEPYKNIYSAFGSEDRDADLDGVSVNDDKCPSTPFNLFVITKDSKKNPSTISYADPVDGTQTTYMRLSKLGAKDITLETSNAEKFSDGTSKLYTVEAGKFAAIDSIAKRVRVLYSNSKKEIAVVAVSDLEGPTRGCAVGEYITTKNSPL